MMEGMNMGHDELFEQLRLKNVNLLGEICAVFSKSDNVLSVF